MCVWVWVCVCVCTRECVSVCLGVSVCVYVCVFVFGNRSCDSMMLFLGSFRDNACRQTGRLDL